MPRLLWRAVVLGAALALVVPANVALADGPSSTARPKKGPPITATAVEDPGGGSPSSGTITVPVLTCQYRSDYPHASQHFPGRVAAEGHTWCPVPATIKTSATLYKHLFLIFWWPMASDSKTVTGLEAVAIPNTPCEGNQLYRIVSDHEVWYGGGYGYARSAQENRVNC